MSTLPPNDPLVYSPAFETPAADEAQTHRELTDTLLGMSRTMAEHTGHAMRSVHAKSHALLKGRLEILPWLPEVLGQGLFTASATYDVVARISTPPAEALDDNVSLPRGFALKVLAVDGARVDGSEGDDTQDFLFVDGPAFSAPDAAGFLKTLKLLAGTTDRVPRLKRAMSTVLQGVEKMVEAVGGESATLIALGGHPETHPLGATFFTQVPILYGPYMAKLQLVPVSPELLALVDRPIEIDGPDGTRQAIVDFFADPVSVGGAWELRVQLCTDLETMPIEDASV
ncbi:MAG: catalase, partial [Comamonadaceae bacterium]